MKIAPTPIARTRHTPIRIRTTTRLPTAATPIAPTRLTRTVTVTLRRQTHSGITNFVYKAQRPFDAGRLMALMYQWPVPIKDELDLSLLKDAATSGYSVAGKTDEKSPFVGVLRSKGFCWFAPTAWEGLLQDAWRHDTAMYWSHAGKHIGIQEAGRWWASVDEERMREFFVTNPTECDRILAQDFVSEEFGDRRQEIVFIGVDLDQTAIETALDECLLTDEEMEAYRAEVKKLEEAIVVETQ